MEVLKDIILAYAGSVFTTELVVATLVLALMSSSVVLGLLAHRKRSSGDSPYRMWTFAWMFFMLHLAASVAATTAPRQPLLLVIRPACLGVCGLLMIWGGLLMMQRRRPQRELEMAVALVVVGGATAYLKNSLFWFDLCTSILVVGATVYVGSLYRRVHPRNPGTQLLAIGFWLWGVPILAYPFAGAWVGFEAIAYFTTAALTLLIAVGLIVDREVSTTEQKYRTVFDSTSDAIFMVDLWSLRVLDANQAAGRLTKHGIPELSGLSFLDLCPTLRKQGTNFLDHRAMFNAVFKPDNDFHIVRADGEMVLCEGETNFAQWNRQPVLQIRVRNVADRQKMHQLVRQAEKMSALGRLVAGVAHELNNPLAVVMGYAELMQKKPTVNDDTKRDLRRILHESERAAKIVRDLLAFARPTEPQLVVVNINHLVGNVLEPREADLREKGIRLVRRLAPNLPPTKADPFQIEQVLTNLVTNAIQAVEEHEGEKIVEVSTEERDFLIRISVSDTGPGIHPKILAKIFEPFFTTKAPGKGTGLGLPISASILEEHHGKLSVESEFGKGARFLIDLPVVTCDEENEQAKDVEEPSSSSKNAEARVLVVDDEPGIVEVLKAILEGNGYMVDTAGNGSEAMKKVWTQGFDLIISDLCMPEMSGEQFYEQVKKSHPGLVKRFLFLTGDTLRPESRAFLERTGSRWFSKPFSVRDIEDAVNQFLRPEPLTALLQHTRPPRGT